MRYLTVTVCQRIRAGILKNKIGCNDCDWHGMRDELLSAPNPFEDDILYACPKCKGMDLFSACEIDGCWKETTNGGTHPDGEYKRACSEHGFFRYK
jgi:hypothetical protein